MTGITERVAAGAAFLDEHDPGWWQRVELPTLDLACEEHCVLGQTCPLEVLDRYTRQRWGDGALNESEDRYLAYASDLSGFIEKDDITDWAIEHGFTLISGRDAPWPDLTAEWKRVIQERRTAS